MPVMVPLHRVEEPRYPSTISQPILANDEPSVISPEHTTAVEGASSSGGPAPPPPAQVSAPSRHDLPYPFMYYPQRYLTYTAWNNNCPDGPTSTSQHEIPRLHVRHEPYSLARRYIREVGKAAHEEPNLHAMKEIEINSRNAQPSGNGGPGDLAADREELEIINGEIDAAAHDQHNPMDGFHPVGLLERLINMAYATIDMIRARWRRQA
ncbi:hypothetical protein FISHEDRAFT_61329 [Fistulina hepatica ATCC 64428]|uniref:Uncharacterized protein n=1 Tax=Fistulina hepatica ATCC 64428 TaxID=1128425 RepID=A0A0D7A445_9AGAR|nr:hypothetical protein FISHEDRAFT_61329 [Fistulina hepatica ATCC 64428]